MKTINGIVIGLLLGVGVGLWLGINIGRDVPLSSNPFKEPSVAETLGDKAGRLYDDAKEAINEQLK